MLSSPNKNQTEVEIEKVLGQQNLSLEEKTAKIILIKLKQDKQQGMQHVQQVFKNAWADYVFRDIRTVYDESRSSGERWLAGMKMASTFLSGSTLWKAVKADLVAYKAEDVTEENYLTMLYAALKNKWGKMNENSLKGFIVSNLPSQLGISSEFNLQNLSDELRRLLIHEIAASKPEYSFGPQTPEVFNNNSGL